MKAGVHLLLISLFLACFLSCEKSEVVDTDSPFNVTVKKAKTSRFADIANTSLKTYNDLEGFGEVFLGTWHVLEVITLNPLGQWIYLDYSDLNLEYEFMEDCRFYNPGEMMCRFESSHSADPSGIFEITKTGDNQKLYLKSDLSSLTLQESYWGDIYHWPAAPDLMIVHKPEAPFWIIMERIFVE